MATCPHKKHTLYRFNSVNFYCIFYIVFSVVNQETMKKILWAQQKTAFFALDLSS